MWYIILCLVGAAVFITALNTIVYDILPNQDARFRCTPKYSKAKDASDESAYIHNIVKLVLGIFIVVFGVAKTVISHGGEPGGLWVAVKTAFNTSTLGTIVDIATSIYFTIKYKLLLAKNTLNEEITRKVALKSANTDCHLSADIEVFRSVRRIVGQYWEIGIIAILLLIFGLVIY